MWQNGLVPIAVSIIEDNPGMRESLAAFLNDAPGLKCASAYASGEDAVREIPQKKPDVALVDIHLPGMTGIECVARLKAQLPELQVLMLSLHEESDLVFNSIQAGASGYLLKSTPAAELIESIEQVHSGGAPMTMQIARKVVDHFRKMQQESKETDPLTPREQEVLKQLAKGSYYREIASTLGISIATVRAHVHSTYKKLHIRSRAEAMLKYYDGKKVAK